jgi:periplasmic protein TonB
MSGQLPRLIFLQAPGPHGGGGGGGARRRSAPARAASIGRDRLSAPVAPRRVVTASSQPVERPLTQDALLDVKPLASGKVWIAGLPDGVVSPSGSRGPGSGSGIGDGYGSGIGSGVGPGVGPGTGGGTGGGVYQVGGGVTAPSLLFQAKPKYTAEGLQYHIQGTVVLRAIVGRNGVPYAIEVTRSLDRGLDEAAVTAIREWRFLPGRLDGVAVDVLIRIEIDFHVR